MPEDALPPPPRIAPDPDDRPWRAPAAVSRSAPVSTEPVLREPSWREIDERDADPNPEVDQDRDQDRHHARDYDRAPPAYARYARKKASAATTWLWALGVGVLLGTLTIQSTYLMRVEIARQWPQLRPTLVAICGQLGCEMPLPRHAQTIRVSASDLESDPERPTDFILHARVHNEARYLQAFPYLELTITDARDRPLARRVLEPAEWLDPESVEAGFGGRSHIELRLPFNAPELSGAAGYRLYAFYP